MRKALLVLLMVGVAGVCSAAPVNSLEDSRGRQLPVLTPGTAQSFAYTGTAAQSSAVTGTAIRLLCSTDCFYAIGSNPTATTSDHFLPAGAAYDLKITPGNKVSAIQASSGGNAYITEWE